MNTLPSYCGLVDAKNKSFGQRFTCTVHIFIVCNVNGDQIQIFLTDSHWLRVVTHFITNSATCESQNLDMIDYYIHFETHYFTIPH